MGKNTTKSGNIFEKRIYSKIMSTKLHGFPLSSEFEVNCFGQSLRSHLSHLEKSRSRAEKIHMLAKLQLFTWQVAR